MAKFAQHFLINAHAIERIIASLNIADGDQLLEIGPGKGALTIPLMQKPIQLTVIEVDPKMVGDLKSRFGAKSNFKIIHKDVTDCDLNEIEGTHIKIVGNLPYNLTSPILRLVCDWQAWDTATFMVQKEVGDRLVAKVSTAEYGALTVGVSLNCEAERVFDLSESSFKPPPRVKSTVVKLTRRAQPLTDDISKVQRVVQAAFQQRRKTILNSLSHGLNLDKEKVEQMLSAQNIPVTARAENLTVQHYIALSEKFELNK